MSSAKVVDIDFFTIDTLPPRLAAIAVEQGVKLGSDLIMVRTKIGPAPSYQFDSVGSSPREIQKLMQKLASEDGVDLNSAVKRAFAEYHSSEQTTREEAEG